MHITEEIGAKQQLRIHNTSGQLWTGAEQHCRSILFYIKIA